MGYEVFRPATGDVVWRGEHADAVVLLRMLNRCQDGRQYQMRKAI